MKEKLEKIIKKAVGARRLEKTSFEVFVPEKEEFGHYSTNAALRLAKTEKKNPQGIAAWIIAAIEKTADRKLFERMEVAAPGFVNFWLSKTALAEEFGKIAKASDKYGRSDRLKGKKIMVEFTDPNPFKEFHVGHLYSNIVGETLSRLLESQGATVKRANYQGDVGMHVAKAVWGMKKKMEAEKTSLRELGKKTLDHRIGFMAKAYASGAKAYEEDSEAKLEIADLNRKIFSLDKDVKDLYRSGRKWSLEYFESIYKRLGTKFDFYYFESDVGESGLKLVEEGLKKGIFEESEGAIVFPGEKYGLHRRVFINSQGLPVYEAKELGLEFKKYGDFPFEVCAIVTGNEITDYFKVLIAAIKQINPRLGDKIKHIPHGMVRLPSGKMSSRTGEVVRGEDLLDEMKSRVFKILASSPRKIPADRRNETAEAIAVGAVKYAFLKPTLGGDIIFDFERSLNLQGDSGPYLQYTYARLKSIIRKAGKVSSVRHQIPNGKNTFLPAEEQELRLVRKIIEFSDSVEEAAGSYLPNHLAKYLYELAAVANKFYESSPILKDKDKKRRQARLTLVSVATETLKNGLNLLGIKVPEKI